MVARSRAKFPSVSRAAVVSDLTPERRWSIVLARDRRYDGAFVYAVQSTGIYCRPSCPSRRPRREHVTFFPVPEAAEAGHLRRLRDRSEEHTSELQSRSDLVCRLLLEKKKPCTARGALFGQAL